MRNSLGIGHGESARAGIVVRSGTGGAEECIVELAPEVGRKKELAVESGEGRS